MGNLLSVLHLVDSGGLYGAENVIINLSQGLKIKRHKTIIGCFCYKGRAIPEVGIRARELGFDTLFIQMENKIDFSCVKTLANYCKTNDIKIVHSHGYKPSFICFFLRLFYSIPYIITCHLWYLSHIRLKIYGFFEILAMTRAEAVVGVSQSIINDLSKIGVSNKKLHLIHNGIDTGKFSKSSKEDIMRLRQNLSLKSNSFVIGSVGRLTEQKSQITIIKAAKEILKKEFDVEFIIAGEGRLKNFLVSLTNQLTIHDNFHFIGFQKNIYSILNLIDIFVLSSLDEGLPIALLEAMAAGCPIVSTAVGEIPFVLENGVNVIFFEPNNFLQLKNILINLKNNSSKRESLSKNTFSLVSKNFSINSMSTKYIEIYNRSIKQFYGSSS